MIELRHLSTGYGTHIVAADLNARLKEGELTSLLGPNGVGKSTLLRTLAAFQPALAGEVFVQGQPLGELSASEISQKIGVVLTERLDVRNMTAYDMVAMGRSPYTDFWGRLTDEDRQLIDEAIEQTGIGPLRERSIQTLSDGERQKVMIAKALAQSTPIILLDEPTAFLDFPSKVEMLRLLKRLAHEMNKCICLSTHDVEMALQLSDCVWLMEASGRLATGSPRELARDGSIARFVSREGVSFDAESFTLRIEG
ncbi:MAG: ABC transporter ATP-binding protein [Bacteroidaceae bacterium]|nr:ABC transporter ATP-binding protein [Bacteroidaceae bacterium]